MLNKCNCLWGEELLFTQSLGCLLFISRGFDGKSENRDSSEAPSQQSEAENFAALKCQDAEEGKERSRGSPGEEQGENSRRPLVIFRAWSAAHSVTLSRDASDEPSLVHPG